MGNFLDCYLIAEQIPGWLHPKEAQQLYLIGRQANTNILEVGTYFGRSTFLFAQSLKNRGASFSIITIDVHWRGVDTATRRPAILASDSQLYLSNMIKKYDLDNQIIQMIGWSSSCLNFVDMKCFGIVFIDGSHEYADCSRDFLTIYNKMHAGQEITFLFHDYADGFPGVKRTIDEIVRKIPTYREISLTYSLLRCVIKKTD